MKDTWFAHMADRALTLSVYPDPRFPPSPYYRFFKLLTQAMQPTLSVELGLCGGGGSFHMALGWPGGTVVGIEHEKGDAFQQANWEFMRKRLANFVLWPGDSVKSAPEIAKAYGEVDILFIDTLHETAWTQAEWSAWVPFMKDRAVICVDDVQREEMAGLWDWIPWQKMRLDILHPGGLNARGYGDGGFGVCWR